MTGWIKLHRKITEKAVWQDPEMLKLWIYCLLKASHTETEAMVGKQKIKLAPGQFVTGRFALADEYNRGAKRSKVVHERTLWRWLKKFEEWGMLSIKSTSKYSVVTIKNWHAYQQNDQQMSSRCPADVQQVSTNKNVKNEKNLRNIVPTEQPGGCEQDLPNKKDVIAEMVEAYRSVPGVQPKKADYSFLGKLFNEYGPGEVYAAIKALARKMESGPVDDPYSYLTAVAKAKYEEGKSKVTPLRRRDVGQFNDLPRAERERMEREARGEEYNTEEDPVAKAKIMEELNRMRRRFEEKRRAGGQ